VEDEDVNTLLSSRDDMPLEPRLMDALATATSVKQACGMVTALLARDPALMPSIYLERGGRLRCQAVAGYWQIFDGIRPGGGVIGRTYLRGQSVVVEDVAKSDDYLEAVPTVRGEACVPIVVAGVPIGAVNVESEQPLPPELAETLERCAELLGGRIEELGGLPLESRSQRLARHATALAGLSHSGAIGSAVVSAACDVAEMQSALLAVPERGVLEVAAAHGPHAERLSALGPDTLSQIASWVGSATSSYSIGDPSGRGFDGHEVLRDAGAAAIVVLPVHVPGSRDGLLLLVDRLAIDLDTNDVELLELLAAQAGSALQKASALAELHERAARDPLTELGHHATFLGALSNAVAGTDEQPFALLVIDVDGFKAVNDRHGHSVGDRLLVRCTEALRRGLRAGDGLYRIGGDEFAALLAGVDGEKAVTIAQELRGAVAELAGPTVSIGVAEHARGETHAALFSRADAALYEAKRAGRDAVALG